MKIYPLNATQEDMLHEADMHTLETSYCINAYVEIPKKRCSVDELADACQTVLDTIHYTHSHLVRQDGKLMISEETDMPNHVHRYEMTDEEWNTGKEHFVKPFRMLEEPGVRFNVVATETKTIFCIEYNHLFFDGISIKGVLNAVEDALAGRPLEDQGDIAAQWNLAEIASYDTDAYRRAQQATCEKFRNARYTDICRTTDNPYGQTLYACYLLAYERMSHIRLNSGALTEDQQQKMMTTICVAAYALALGQMAGVTEVVFMTTNHGRVDKRLNFKVLGNFLKSMSLRIDTDPEQSVAELISKTRTALFGMMRTIGYPWTHMVRDLQLSPAEQVGTEMNVSGSGISVLDAGKEVNDILASQQYAQRAIALNTQQVEKLTEVLTATELRMQYDSEVNYLQVLLARQSLLEARLSLLSNQYALIEAAIGLYRALGGGNMER